MSETKNEQIVFCTGRIYKLKDLNGMPDHTKFEVLNGAWIGVTHGNELYIKDYFDNLIAIRKKSEITDLIVKILWLENDPDRLSGAVIPINDINEIVMHLNRISDILDKYDFEKYSRMDQINECIKNAQNHISLL